MKFYFFSGLILFMTWSCKESKNYLKKEKTISHEIKENAEYTAVDTLVIAIDKITDPLLYPDFQFKIINSRPYIIFKKLNNEIEFVSLENPKDRFSALFSTEGPNAVAGDEAFYAHNEDSIFFLSSNQLKKISLHNRKGKLINKWDLNASNEEEWMGESMFFDFKYNPVLNEIYYWTYHGKIKNRSTRSTFKVKAFDIINETIREVGFIPAHYKKINYHPFYEVGSFVSLEKNLMLNFFPPINRIYVSDLVKDSTKNKIIELVTEDFPKFTNPLMDKGEADSEIEEELAYLVESNFIYKIISNEMGNLFYIFHRNGLPFLKPDGSQRNMYEYDFEVIVLNSDLKPKGIINFEQPDHFFSHASFALNNKLYISLNNPINPNFNEDFVQFIVYEIQ